MQFVLVKWRVYSLTLKDLINQKKIPLFATNMGRAFFSLTFLWFLQMRFCRNLQHVIHSSTMWKWSHRFALRNGKLTYIILNFLPLTACVRDFNVTVFRTQSAFHTQFDFLWVNRTKSVRPKYSSHVIPFPQLLLYIKWLFYHVPFWL